jgi:hypothetical protein
VSWVCLEDTLVPSTRVRELESKIEELKILLNRQAVRTRILKERTGTFEVSKGLRVGVSCPLLEFALLVRGGAQVLHQVEDHGGNPKSGVGQGFGLVVTEVI